MSVAITIDNVVKRFGKDTIINGLSVDVRPGEFFTLLGPSGCGKTTLLRMIIGFNSIEGGTIKIDDQISLMIYQRICVIWAWSFRTMLFFRICQLKIMLLSG